MEATGVSATTTAESPAPGAAPATTSADDYFDDEFLSFIFADSAQSHAEAATGLPPDASADASTDVALPSVPPSPPGALASGSAVPLLHGARALQARMLRTGHRALRDDQSQQATSLMHGRQLDFRIMSVLVQLLAVCQIAYKRARAAEQENIVANVVVGVFCGTFVVVRAITSLALPAASTTISAWLVHHACTAPPAHVPHRLLWGQHELPDPQKVDC